MRVDGAGRLKAAAVPQPPPLLSITLPGDPVAVRAALERAMAALEPLALTPECRNVAELVLAEVLNNVVEHAYSAAPGPIELEIRLADGRVGPALACSVCDRGRPMPDGTPPLGRQALVDVPLDDLPEGGFGWFLIRSLTRDLDYVRSAGGNRLAFLIPLERHDEAN